MELYKDKEEADAVKREKDLSLGLKISEDDIDFTKFGELGHKSNKAILHNDLLKTTKETTEFNEVRNFKQPLGEGPDTTPSNGAIPIDDAIDIEVAEAILSIEELMEHLDNGEKELDV